MPRYVKISALAGLLLVGVAQGQTFSTATWDGTGSGDNWSTSGNWSGGAPVDNGPWWAINFTGSNSQSILDIAANTGGWNIRELNFNAGLTTELTFSSTGAYLDVLGVSGASSNALIINNSSSTQTITADFLHRTDVNTGMEWQAVSGDIVMSGNITQTSADTADTIFINNSSGRSVTFSGTNDYKTTTTVQAGTLIVGSDTALGATTSGTTVDSGATLQFQNNISIGAEAIANSGTVTNASGTNSYAGVLSGTGDLTVTGGELTLSADNTYTGDTSVNAGTLVISNQTDSANINIASGATLELHVDSGTRNNGANTNFTGTGTLVKTGAGEMQWNSSVVDFALGSGALIDVREGTLRAATGGNDTWTNNLSDLNVESGATFNGAGLQIRVDALTGDGVIQHGYTGGNRLTFGVDNGTATFDGTLEDFTSGTGDFAKVGTGTQTLTGDNSFAGTMAIEGGTLVAAHSNTLGTDALGTSISSGATLSLTNNINIATEALTNNGELENTSGTNTYGGVISGTGVVNVDAGQLTLSNNNTYTGTTTVSAGKLVIEGQTASGTLNVATGAELEFNVASGTRDNSTNTNITGGGTLIKTGAGELQWNSAVVDYALTSGALIDVREGTLRAATGGNDTWTNNLSDLNVESGATFNGAGLQIRVDAIDGDGTIQHGYTGTNRLTFGVDNGTGVFSGTVEDFGTTGPGDFGKVGTGSQTFAGDNTFTGTLAVEAGTLVAAHSNALGSASTGTSVNSGATLALTNNITVASEAVTNNGTVTNTSGTNTFNGVISGTGTVTTTGGNLTLSNTNTYSGNTTVGTGSTLTLSAANALGTGSTTVNSGGTLALTGGITVDQTSFDLSGVGNGSAGAVQNLAGSNRLTGDITLSANTTLQSDAGTLNIGTDVDGSVYEVTGDQIIMGANSLTIDGAGATVLRADLTGTGNLIKDGNGQFTMANGTNSWTGTTQINDGEMVLATYFNDAPGVGPLADYGIRGPVIIGDGTEGASTATLTLGTADSGSGNFSNMFAGNVDITVNSDGRLDTRGHTTYVRDIDLDGGSINAQTGASGGNNLFVTGDITSTSTTQTATIDGFLDFNADADQSINVAASSTLDINARIQNGGIDKSGDGTLIVSGGNTFTDDVDVLDGIVRVDNNLGLGSITGGTNVSSGAQLQLDGVSIGNEALTLNGTGISADGALQTIASSGANSWAGNVTIATNAEIETATGSTLAISGNITGSGKTLTVESIGDTTFSGTNTLNTLNKTGAGNLTVTTNNNTYATANINSGTFTLGTDNILSDAMDVNIGASGTFNLGTHTEVIDDIVGSGTLQIASGGNLTIDELGGSLTGGNPTGGFTGTLDNDGIMTLNGGTISGGTGSGSTGEMILTASNTLTIASDFTYGTVGTMGGGDQLGTLTLQDAARLVISGGSTVNIGTLNIDGDSIIDFTAAESNTLNLGSLTFTAGSTLLINGWNSFNDLWTSQNFPGASLDIRDANTAKITFSGFGADETIWKTFDFGAKEITVPEPSSYGAILMAFALAAWTTRRRRSAV